MKQTAVEWIIEQFKDYDCTPASNNDEYVIVMPKWIFNAKKDESLKQEKQQIIDAYNKSFELRDKPYSTADKYYNETYGSKGSDDHIVDTNEMADQFPDVRKMVEDKVQKLIDKDIFDQATLAMEEHYGSGCETEIDAYFRGAKWMQEQNNKI